MQCDYRDITFERIPQLEETAANARGRGTRLALRDQVCLQQWLHESQQNAEQVGSSAGEMPALIRNKQDYSALSGKLFAFLLEVHRHGRARIQTVLVKAFDLPNLS